MRMILRDTEFAPKDKRYEVDVLLPVNSEMSGAEGEVDIFVLMTRAALMLPLVRFKTTRYEADAEAIALMRHQSENHNTIDLEAVRQLLLRQGVEISLGELIAKQARQPNPPPLRNDDGQLSYRSIRIVEMVTE